MSSTRTVITRPASTAPNPTHLATGSIMNAFFPPSLSLYDSIRTPGCLPFVDAPQSVQDGLEARADRPCPGIFLSRQPGFTRPASCSLPSETGLQTFPGMHLTDDPTYNAQLQRLIEGLRKAGVPEGEGENELSHRRWPASGSQAIPQLATEWRLCRALQSFPRRPS